MHSTLNAQGLVFNTIGLLQEQSVTCNAGSASEATAGPDREVLLTRLVEQLKGRLQTYKEENQQLEEMLHQSDARASSELLFACHFSVYLYTQL